MDTFAVQDKLFQIFTNDAALLYIMGNPITDEEINKKFRRQTGEFTEINNSDLPFVSFIFIASATSENYCYNQGLLELDIVCQGQEQAKQIFRIIKPLLQQNFVDMRAVTEGQVKKGVSGFYCYRIRYKPLINS